MIKLTVLSTCVLAGSAWAEYHGHFGPVLGNHFGISGNATYDYVVVGGGTAGLAVAYRLAEDGLTSVAVVEAGGFYEVGSLCPYLRCESTVKLMIFCVPG